MIAHGLVERAEQWGGGRGRFSTQSSPGASTVPGSDEITTVRSSRCLIGIWKPHSDSVSEIFFVMYRS